MAEAYRNPRFQAVPTTLWPTRAGSCSVVLKYQRVPGPGGPWEAGGGCAGTRLLPGAVCAGASWEAAGC